MQVGACAGRRCSAVVQGRRRHTQVGATHTLGTGQNQGEETKNVDMMASAAMNARPACRRLGRAALVEAHTQTEELRDPVLARGWLGAVAPEGIKGREMRL